MSRHKICLLRHRLNRLKEILGRNMVFFRSRPRDVLARIFRSQHRILGYDKSGSAWPSARGATRHDSAQQHTRHGMAAHTTRILVARRVRDREALSRQRVRSVTTSFL